MTTPDFDRLAQTERNIATLNVMMQRVLDELEEARNERTARVLPSVSNPASENHEILREYHEQREHSFDTQRPRYAKPATPNDFSGDRTKGRAFINSCELYMALAPHQFADDNAKIMWAFSFMKTDRASRFVARHMRNYQTVGGLSYATWNKFVAEFITEFCPKNELLTSRTDLETSKYFQGSRNVDEYVDEFRELIDRARYFEGAHIVMKFRQGLNPRIQDYVACLTSGRPSDDDPKSWYAAAILCDENRIANEAFKASSRLTPHVETPPSNGGLFRRPPTWQTNTPLTTSRTAIPPSRFALPIATPSNPSLHSTPTTQNTTNTATTVCYRCGQAGHSQRDCPRRFDIRYMDIEERRSFAEDEFAALDVAEMEAKSSNIVEEEETPGFGRDSEC